MASDPYVLRADVELRENYNETLTVTVRRLYGQYASGPSASDIPEDFRVALQTWLDQAKPKAATDEVADDE